MPLADPLSDVLSLLAARSMLSASLRASGEWSVQLPAEGVKFNAIVEGGCFLIPQPFATPIRLEAGDCLLLANCGSYVLCSDPALTPVEARDVFVDGSASIENDGDGGLFAIGGRIELDETDASLMLDALPPFFHISRTSPEAPAIHWLLTRFRDEWGGSLPGSTLAADHLAQLLFVEALRAWLRSPDAPATGWLHALGDRRIGAAIRALHHDPSRRWKLMDMAEAAGMSRSNFALQFKKLVGLAPLEYLLRWRMRLGAKALRAGTVPISSISFSLGYESESAFSSAFKRVRGVAPIEYRRSYRRPTASSIPAQGGTDLDRLPQDAPAIYRNTVP